MIPIETEKRRDWNAIRAEYIGGDTSYRLLAEKYGLSKDAIARKAQKQHWEKDRATARDMGATASIQKTAEAVADNAIIATDLKKRLLLRLGRIEEKYPMDATEVKVRDGNKWATYRIRDLTAAYKDLTEDMPMHDGDKNTPIYELLRKLDGECDV